MRSGRLGAPPTGRRRLAGRTAGCAGALCSCFLRLFTTGSVAVNRCSDTEGRPKPIELHSPIKVGRKETMAPPGLLWPGSVPAAPGRLHWSLPLACCQKLFIHSAAWLSHRSHCYLYTCMFGLAQGMAEFSILLHCCLLGTSDRLFSGYHSEPRCC